MALEIVWTSRALNGLDLIVEYLKQNWTDKEIRAFFSELKTFTQLISERPDILQKSDSAKNVYRGPMNKLAIITYRVKPRKKQLEILNLRAAKQKPKK